MDRASYLFHLQQSFFMQNILYIHHPLHGFNIRADRLHSTGIRRKVETLL